MSSINSNSTSEIEIILEPPKNIKKSVNYNKNRNKKLYSVEDLVLRKNIMKNDLREKSMSNIMPTKPLFVWIMKTQNEKVKINDLKSLVKESSRKSDFNVIDHDLSNYRNAHLVGQTSTIFVKGIDINAMEEDIKEFFVDIQKPIEIRYKYDENGERPGFAFITFSNPDLASQAVIQKNKGYICDRYVYTDWAKERKNNLEESSKISGPKHIELKGTTTRIWIGNLNRKVMEKQLREHFISVGEISDIYIIGRDPSRPRIAYLSFVNTKEADKAVEEMQGSEILGQNIRIDWANERRNFDGKKRKRELSQKEKGCITIFVGGLTDDVTDEDLIKIFKDCGEISQIRKIQKDGVFKGIAFIEFSKTEATDKAISMNGIEYKGKLLRIDYASSRKK